jgi:hypothetical protein
MKTFIIDADHNITAYASQEAASSAVPPGDAFATAAGLRTALKNYSAATVAGIWNSLTGVTPVKKFTSLDVKLADWCFARQAVPDLNQAGCQPSSLPASPARLRCISERCGLKGTACIGTLFTPFIDCECTVEERARPPT